MNRQFNSDGETLQSLIERLDKSHYDSISALCDTAKEQVQRLQEQEVQQQDSQYITLCNQLIGEIQQYIRSKKEHLIPYVHSLFEKDTVGHDCRNCTGNGPCSLQHDRQLVEINQSHKQLKEIVYRLQMASLPLYSGTLHLNLYKILQNQMAILANSLATVFSLEETYLIPKIMAAQKNINARSQGV